MAKTDFSIFDKRESAAQKFIEQDAQAGRSELGFAEPP